MKRIGKRNYFIDEQGNVFNEVTGKYLKPYRTPKGYLTVDICVDVGRKNFLVHRLMGFVFLGLELNSKLQINHKDGNKGNNFLSNLEIMDNRENSNHAVTIHSNKRMLDPSVVLEIVAHRRAGKGPTEIAKMYNTTSDTVCNIMCGKSYYSVTGF